MVVNGRFYDIKTLDVLSHVEMNKQTRQYNEISREGIAAT